MRDLPLEFQQVAWVQRHYASQLALLLKHGGCLPAIFESITI